MKNCGECDFTSLTKWQFSLGLHGTPLCLRTWCQIHGANVFFLQNIQRRPGESLRIENGRSILQGACLTRSQVQRTGSHGIGSSGDEKNWLLKVVQIIHTQGDFPPVSVQT